MPNPNADKDDAAPSSHGNGRGQGDERPTLRAIERAVAGKGWKLGAERGYDEQTHCYKIYKTRDGMGTLEALRDALYREDERGCRIRRETQAMYYVCCDGVRVRLNESKSEVVVEVPCDMATVKAIEETCAKIDGVVKAKK